MEHFCDCSPWDLWCQEEVLDVACKDHLVLPLASSMAPPQEEEEEV